MNQTKNTAEKSKVGLRLRELFRNYELSLELIQNAKNPDELLDQILEEYIKRFDEIPGTDLMATYESKNPSFNKEKLKSLIMFATQATMLKENADYLGAMELKNHQLKELARDLKASNEKLQKLNSHYLNMLSFVSHELRSPLISILGFAELLEDEIFGKLNDEQKDSVSIIINSAKNLLNMTKSYLDLSRIENGELKVKFRAVNIQKDVIIPVITEMQNQFDKKQMPILQVNGENLPDIILFCDPELVRNVFYNLFSNALKYGYERTPIEYEIINQMDDVKFIVKNACEGIPEDKLNLIFEKFIHLNEELTDERPRGTGLGLYISQLIIATHNGKIWADSDHRSWVKISFTIPKGKLSGTRIIQNQVTNEDILNNFFTSGTDVHSL
jgi:signal transduction histidine kinase